MKALSAVAPIGGLALARLLAGEPPDFLPPAPAWHGASEALIARPDHPWVTPAERMHLLASNHVGFRCVKTPHEMTSARIPRIPR